MGKEISFDKTMGRMLDTIPDEFDKRETSIIYQAVAIVVPELMTLQSDIELLEDEAFPDTCNHNNLIRFSSLRNIHPRPATRGTVIAEFNMEVEIGTRFNCEERNYEVIEKIEEKIGSIAPVTTLISEGKSPEDILELILGDLNLEINEKIEAGFRCNCSRERIEKALISIGRKELETMVSENKPIEVGCHFCNKKYNFNVNDIEQILEEVKSE